MKKAKRKVVKKIIKRKIKPNLTIKKKKVQQRQPIVVKDEVQPSIGNEDYIENSNNYSTNSQNSLMDNSEKRIPINRIIHNLKDSTNEEELLKNKILEYGRKKTYISSVFQNNDSNQEFGIRNKTNQDIESFEKPQKLPKLSKKDFEKEQKNEGYSKSSIENSDNYSTNSQNSLMDNSEKRIPINRIIHNLMAGQQDIMSNINSSGQKMELPPLPKRITKENVEIKEKAKESQEVNDSKGGNDPKNENEIRQNKKIEEISRPVKDIVGDVNNFRKGFDSQKAPINGKAKQLNDELTNEFFNKSSALNRDQKILDSYSIEVDRAKIKVEIIKSPFGVVYNIYLPKISPATAALLDEIRNELISVTTVSMQELTDPSAFSSIKERFMSDARNILREKLPNINLNIEDFLVGILMQEMLGLGSIEFLLNDQSLEEIVIPSAKENIRVFSKKYGWLITNIRIEKEEEIINYSNIIARRVGRQITVLNPLLDAHLVTGDRVNAVLYPIGTKGNTITVRKFSRDPFTIVDFINSKTCDADVASLLWLAVEFEMNILISGGTGSGKTSFLNAIMPFIPPNQRIISIEDTRELMLPEFLYWAPLVTRTPNPEGKGEVSMLDLLVNSLRMRPDRIILGEMRRQQEAMVLFEAMHTGHSVYATVHADTAAETISRLVNPPLNVPPNLLKAVNLNVVMFRDRKKGIRRVLQIAEFEAGKEEARANILYRWIPEEDRLKLHSESSRFFEDIGRHTGLSDTEIKKDLAEKKKILLWMVKHNIRKLQDFGKILNYYYKNKEFLINKINRDDVRGILEG